MAKKKKTKLPGDRVIATNRKAFHDYIINDKFEAGIALVGTEVKSLREGRVNLKESYVRPQVDELMLIDCHINPYKNAGNFNHQPTRPRRLLLHKRELQRLIAATTQKGFTIVPLRFYLKGRLIKLEIALAQGKKLYDKRETKRQKDIDRETERAMRDRN